MAGVLERGSPHEFLPKSRELELYIRAAEKYVRDQGNPPDGRTRVREVWLQGQYQPAYQRITPRKPDADDFG